MENFGYPTQDVAQYADGYKAAVVLAPISQFLISLYEPININPPTGSSVLSLIKPTATDRSVITGFLNSTERWAEILGDGTAETGSNAGSDFEFCRYSDAGSLLDCPMSIPRSTGRINLIDGLSVTGDATVSGDIIARNVQNIELTSYCASSDLGVGNNAQTCFAAALSDICSSGGTLNLPVGTINITAVTPCAGNKRNHRLP
jgi:hypothetical protein